MVFDIRVFVDLERTPDAHPTAPVRYQERRGVNAMMVVFAQGTLDSYCRDATVLYTMSSVTKQVKLIESSRANVGAGAEPCDTLGGNGNVF